jgi:hypothetical protein
MSGYERQRKVVGGGTRRDQFLTPGTVTETRGVAATQVTQRTRSSLIGFEGDVRPGGRVGGRMKHPRAGNAVDRVFGGGRRHPREAAVVMAVEHHDAAQSIGGDAAVMANQGQYYMTRVNGVQPGDQLPTDTLVARAGGARTAPHFRRNRHTGETVQASAPVVLLDGGLSQGVRKEMMQFAPPDGLHYGEMQNNVKVRGPLNSRYTHPRWASNQKHYTPRPKEQRRIDNVQSSPQEPAQSMRVVPRLQSSVAAQAGSRPNARVFEERAEAIAV